MACRTCAVGFLAAVLASMSLLVSPAHAGLDRDGPGALTAASTATSADTTSANRTGTAAQLVRPPWTNTACPEMTDSITRLYTAYFNRQPEQGGFEFWLDAYRLGEWNLDRMSQHFSVSQEFVDTYGALGNAEFVDLIYRNIHGREADAEGRAFWTAELDAGRMTRGRVMIFFSESEEYVTSTQTVRPLAGYLGWYPEGTTWSCGFGAASVRLSPDVSFTDIFIDNLSREAQTYTIVSYDPNYADPIVEDTRTVPTNSYIYYTNARLSPAYGYLELQMSDEMWWIVVDAPVRMVDPRPGWF